VGVVLPEQVIGDQALLGVDDGDGAGERERLIALEVQDGRERARELGDGAGIGTELDRRRAHRNVGPRSARAEGRQGSERREERRLEA
jgi:hypothetical protein